MIEIGKYNQLRIVRQENSGYYLEDDAGEEVLLPTKYGPTDLSPGDLIDVFIYRDSSELKVATTQTPFIQLNEFALLQVNAVTEFGAFLDWGLEKDLIVPFREQRQKMELDRWYIVFLCLDKKTDRLYASNRLEKFLQNEDLNLKQGEQVGLTVLQKTDLGYSVIINHKHKGLIFENELFKVITVGEKLTGYVRTIREDNKIDVVLQPLGYQNSNDANSDLIYNNILNHNGFLALTDKSTPEEIYRSLGISKKAFKKSIGALYKQRKIVIQPDGIKLS